MYLICASSINYYTYLPTYFFPNGVPLFPYKIWVFVKQFPNGEPVHKICINEIGNKNKIAYGIDTMKHESEFTSVVVYIIIVIVCLLSVSPRLSVSLPLSVSPRLSRLSVIPVLSVTLLLSP